MMHSIPEDHPLKKFFAGSIEDAFYSRLGICSPDIVEYLTNLLIEFVHVRDIYSLKNASGEPLRAITDMVSKAHLDAGLPPEQQELHIHRHVGDYTLYWSGMYPESLERHVRGPGDSLWDFYAQGKRSYAIAAELSGLDQARLSTVLGQLSEHFEDCARGLTIARSNWRFGG